MRGLPYSATEQDIYYFFAPLVPLRIIIEKDALGRPSGQGEVIFHTPEDASSAMRKDKSHIGSRYVELFLHSKPSSSSSSSSSSSRYFSQQQQQPSPSSYSNYSVSHGR
jgi:heterogeneous nuclear ribonucleoprotein F/H